jgi:hypothetical protein
MFGGLIVLRCPDYSCGVVFYDRIPVSMGFPEFDLDVISFLREAG